VSLIYRPIVDLTSGDVVGVEALARWVDAVRGPVPPAEFIPVAEETGLVVPLGHALLRNRNAIGIAHHLAFRRGQAGALLGLHRVEHPADRLFGARPGDLAGRICRI